MPYEAVICRVKTRPHPNADRLQLADAGGYQCIVGLDVQDGDVGVVFPEGGQLSDAFCRANSLYRKDPVTKETMGGMLDPDRRIRAVKLRGEQSDALWLPIVALGDGTYREGDKITTMGGVEICRKYLTPATIRAMKSGTPAAKARARSGVALPRHYDTGQLRTAQVDLTGTIYVTEKLHGTSGRTGRVEVEQPLSWLSRTLNRLPLVNIRPKTSYKVVSGTRNCILDPLSPGEKGASYRQRVHDMIAPVLEDGEVWYYEIVGYDDNGNPIMPKHPIRGLGTKHERALRGKCGDFFVTYNYGCECDGSSPGRPSGRPSYATGISLAVWVYRVVRDGKDLGHCHMSARVYEAWKSAPSLDLGRFVSTVPLIERFDPGHFSSQAELLKACDRLSRGESLEGMPFIEGVCVRSESPSGVSKAYKHKSFVFCALEGIRKNDPEYIDTEEAA